MEVASTVPSARARLGAIVALALIVCWQLWVGIARAQSTGCPAGEAGLCLALVFWWLGGSAWQGLGLWGVALLGTSLVNGLDPVWPFLIGWPAWLTVRVLAAPRVGPPPPWLGFVAIATGMITLCRCAGKLLLQAAPWISSPLTLSGRALPSSLWAEAAPNLLFLLFFGAMLGAYTSKSASAPAGGEP